MGNLLNHVLSTLQEDGPIAVYKWGIRWMAWKAGLDPLYRRILPETKTLSIAGVTTTYTNRSRSLFYDYVDDAKSEGEVVADLLDEVDAGDVFFDVGANVGLYTCTVAEARPDATVVAFDPNPELAAICRENVALNGLDVDVRECALSDSSGTTSLVLAGPTQARIETLEDEGDETVEVEVSRADTFVEEGLPAPTVVKIDVEGAEYDVLKGFGALLSEHVRAAYVEVHGEKITDYGATEADLLSLLESAGFTVKRLDARRSQVYYKAVREEGMADD